MLALAVLYLRRSAKSGAESLTELTGSGDQRASTSSRWAEDSRMSATRHGRLLIRVEAGLFVAFGAGFIVAPVALADLLTGSHPSSTSGVIDLRATYGGLALGLALTWIVLDRAQQTRLALLSAGMVLTCVAAARIVGMVADGSPNGVMWALLASEILFAALSFRASRAAGPGPAV